jgi:hypothetical protein
MCTEPRKSFLPVLRNWWIFFVLHQVRSETITCTPHETTLCTGPLIKSDLSGSLYRFLHLSAGNTVGVRDDEVGGVVVLVLHQVRDQDHPPEFTTSSCTEPRGLQVLRSWVDTANELCVDQLLLLLALGTMMR